MRGKIDPDISLENIRNDYDWASLFEEAILGDTGGAACSSWRTPEENEGYQGPVRSVVEVIAASPGENDEASWLGVFLLGEPYNKYAVIAGGCDYTGWDCMGNYGTVEYYQDINAAVSQLALTNEMRERLGDQLRQKELEGRLKLDWSEETVSGN